MFWLFGATLSMHTGEHCLFSRAFNNTNKELTILPFLQFVTVLIEKPLRNFTLSTFFQSIIARKVWCSLVSVALHAPARKMPLLNVRSRWSVIEILLMNIPVTSFGWNRPCLIGKNWKLWHWLSRRLMSIQRHLSMATVRQAYKCMLWHGRKCNLQCGAKLLVMLRK